MNKALLTLYLIIFGSYIIVTRQPDYFDGEKYPATIRIRKDAGSNNNIAKAFYSIGANKYEITADYIFYHYREGEKIEIIVELEHPEKAAVYRYWGYWITWEELLSSIIIAFILFQVAVSITNNPTKEALAEQLAYKEEKKTKYV